MLENNNSSFGVEGETPREVDVDNLAVHKRSET